MKNIVEERKHFADCVKNRFDVEELEQKIINIEDSDFIGDIYLNNFIKVKSPRVLENGVCIQNNNYKWLEFYDYNSKIRLTAMYNEKNEIIEWYFDIARCIGKEGNIPYEEDLYLDVVLMPDGEIVLLDENELEEAYKKMKITKEEYDDTYRIANDLIKKIAGNKDKIKQFTDKYLNKIL